MRGTGESTYARHFLVDLSRSHAFAIRVLGCGHFEHTHAKGVDVHALVVMLLVHLGSHKLGSADHRLGKGAVLECGQAQVADLDAARRTGDEDVVALHNTVDMYHDKVSL